MLADQPDHREIVQIGVPAADRLGPGETISPNQGRPGLEYEDLKDASSKELGWKFEVSESADQDMAGSLVDPEQPLA